MRAFIFDCSTNTYREYVDRQLFGSFLSWPLQVQPGDLCFLYHHGVRELSGIWRAECAGGHNLVPEAWGGRFPFQVKVEPSTLHILEIPIQEAEELLLHPSRTRLEHMIDGERLAALLERFKKRAETVVC